MLAIAILAMLVIILFYIVYLTINISYIWYHTYAYTPPQKFSSNCGYISND